MKLSFQCGFKNYFVLKFAYTFIAFSCFKTVKRAIKNKKIIKKHERMCNEKGCASVSRVYFYASGLYHKIVFIALFLS